MMALAMLSSASLALPSIEEVQAEVRRNYAQAENLMREVIRARPGSAKARYIYAEIPAHNQRLDQAAQEAQEAREAREAQQIARDLNFPQPDEFRTFEQLLAYEQRTDRSLSSMSSDVERMPALGAQLPSDRSSSLPNWIWRLGAAAVALLLWRTVVAVRRATAMPSAPTPASTTDGDAPRG